MSAAMINKFMKVLGINDNDEYEEDIEQEEVEVEDTYERPARAGYFSRRYIDNTRDEKAEKVERAGKVLSISGTQAVSQTSSKMVITEPECFDDVKDIGEHLKQRRSVIINLETVNKEDQRRIIDFLSGATFVTEGTIQKISSLIYLITPKSVEIQNDIERAQYRSKLSFSWMK